MPRVAKSKSVKDAPKQKEPIKDSEEVVKPKKTFSLKLSKPELTHLRDLFSVLLPADMKATVSQALAANQGKHLLESKLWNKVTQLCGEAEIPMGDEAPDFIVSISSPPSLNVFEMVMESAAAEGDLPRGIEALLREDK